MARQNALPFHFKLWNDGDKMPAWTRRETLKLAATAASAAAVSATPLAALAEPAAPPKLAPTAFGMLPLGAIRPAGWLQRQLRIQADGMGGHLDEFWPDVGANSGWLGGTGESWERGPYFLDGLLPLAVLLNDDVLQAKARRLVEWTLTHQQPDGMIGPATNNDWWPRMVMVKALAQFHDWNGDPRVITVLTKYFHHQLQAMPQRPLRDWGKFRWQDEVLIVEWLHDRTGDPQLLQLAALLKQQGFDWTASFADFKLTEPTTHKILEDAKAGGMNERALQSHGVNNGQALKTAAVQFRMSGDVVEHTNFQRQMSALDRYHGLPNGMFSCDEHLAGTDPSHGTELCTVVETMFSLEVALATFGDPLIGDRLEKITFNALPGTFTDDMWAHQYDQQPNQVQVSLNSKPWSTNGPESNLYGLEPHFGCCTANFHQGWPKFAASLWMSAPDGGLVAALYAPCEVNTTVRGTKVRLVETTDYPFRETIRIDVHPEKAARFPLLLRIPAWSPDAKVQINGTDAGVAATAGTFTRLERTWAPGDRVEITFPMRPRVSRWFNQSIAVERGPLLFSHDPGQNWVKLRDRGMTADWQVFPSGPWNFAIKVDESTAPRLTVTELPVGARPFSTAEPGVRIQVSAQQLDAWRSEDGVAQSPPSGPVVSKAPEQILTLVPYAGAKLRITAFPQLKT
jgi:hypothetical protein